MTGGAGFIGSHLVDRLVKEGCEVVVLDNFSTGRIENLQPVLNRKRFSLVQGDIMNPKDVNRAIENADAVFHLAAFVNVQLSMENPMLANDVNVKGTLNLLRASVEKNVSRFVYASTCAVYGEARHLPINEEHPLSPTSPYGISKLAAEQHCRVLYQTVGLKTVCLRFFNVYGPRQFTAPYGAVITRFVKSLKNNRPLTIHGDGKQTRDFLYVGDVVEACALSLSSKNCVGEVINIGTGVGTTINELAGLLAKLMKKDQTALRHVASRKGDIRHSYADTGKAQRILGYKPKVTLQKGLKGLLSEVQGS